ncbi:MAG: glycosyltransferase [Gemmatimonadetes bacterium]|nr:glycosyltransferase [Gemmatimonadota bacterium]
MSPMQPILWTVPWMVLVAALPFLMRRRPRLASYPSSPGEAPPRVSVVVPTHDDADRIGVCLATLMDSTYPDYEVIVVDCGSVDGTREIVQAIRSRTPHRLRLTRAGPVPDGRPWRAWACMRGCREADGELVLFTEPGTVHDGGLLTRAVAALETEKAHLLTVQPRLTMGGFWERLVMPHVWLLLTMRFPSARMVNRSRSPRNAFAHHQFMLFRREAYEEIGGHSIVRAGDVEDLRLPQAVVGAGQRLFRVHGEEYLETRLLRNFGDLSEDWTGAVPPASSTTVAPWASAFIPWLVAVTPVLLFVLPSLALGLGVALPGAAGPTTWGLWTAGLSLIFWLAIYTWYRIRPAYAVAYPAGALATTVLFIRSLVRSRGGPPRA